MYLLAASSISQDEINEIEGRMAQYGIEVSIVRAASFEYLAIVSDVHWDGVSYTFELSRADRGEVDVVLAEIIKERLVDLGHGVIRDGLVFTVVLSDEAKKELPIIALNRIRWSITATLNFLYTPPGSAQA
ncbi:hypothetical protein MLDJOKPK_00034 [Salmonella phage SPAsTU]|nr:hypothetical protein MLDJOKPK_00034 [Salmonella phage SPAsTU]